MGCSCTCSRSLPPRDSDRRPCSNRPMAALRIPALLLAATLPLALPATSSAHARCDTPRIRALDRARTGPRGLVTCHEGREPGPNVLRSENHPITVHYPDGLEGDAERAILALDLGWDVEVGEMGWPEPLPDEGLCGNDDLDVFLDTTGGGGYTDAATPDLATPWDDWSAFIVLDVNAYGGDVLEATLVHEFNHVLQAALDWWEPIAYFEMSAQYVEYLVWPEDYFVPEVLVDFTSRTEWALDHDDGYVTWFMYGAAEFFMWAEASCVGGAPTWLSDVWRAARSEAGPDVEVPNEPDLRDAFSERFAADCGLDWWRAAGAFRADVWDGVGDEDVIAHSAGWDLEAALPASVALDTAGELEIPVQAEDTGAVYAVVTWTGEGEVQDWGVAPDDGWTAEVLEETAGLVVLLAMPVPDTTVDADDVQPGERTGTIVLDPDGGSTADDDDAGDDDDEEGEGCECSGVGARWDGAWAAAMLGLAAGARLRRGRRG